jgi:hypothetical protein
MPSFQVRQRVYPSCQYRLRSTIKVIVVIETVLYRIGVSKRYIQHTPNQKSGRITFNSQ